MKGFTHIQVRSDRSRQLVQRLFSDAEILIPASEFEKHRAGAARDAAAAARGRRSALRVWFLAGLWFGLIGADLVRFCFNFAAGLP